MFQCPPEDSACSFRRRAPPVATSNRVTLSGSTPWPSKSATCTGVPTPILRLHRGVLPRDRWCGVPSPQGLSSRSEDASGRGRRPLGDLVGSRLPGANIRRGDVRSVTELGAGADRAPDRDLGSLVVFGIVAAEGDPALAELAATAPTLNAIQHRRTPFPPARPPARHTESNWYRGPCSSGHLGSALRSECLLHEGRGTGGRAHLRNVGRSGGPIPAHARSRCPEGVALRGVGSGVNA